jgi:hypothetical protein
MELYIHISYIHVHIRKHLDLRTYGFIKKKKKKKKKAQRHQRENTPTVDYRVMGQVTRNGK